MSARDAAGPVVALPASSGQERLWFADQLHPGAALYNVHFAVRLLGDLRPHLLERALQQVVDRHEVLRTTLRAVGGQARQVVAERLTVPTPVHDLDGEPPAGRGACAARHAAEHAGAVLDLAAGPLLRSDLLRFAADDHAWLLTLHHAVCDGWSAPLLFAEVSAAYAALVGGAAPDLPELPLQYADYAIWQREELAEGMADGLDHWRRTLRDHPPLLDLPTDRPRPPVQSHRGALVETEIPGALAEAVRALARERHVTPFVTLLAAFAVTLHRYSGAEDLVIGTAVGGRRRAELEPLIGFFTDTAALRIAVSAADTFTDVLGRTMDVVLDAQAHARVPFDEVVRAVRPDRDTSYHPVFQVMFDVQPGGTGSLQLPGVAATVIPVLDRRVSLFDLSLSVVEGDRMGLVAEYATDLFDRDTVERHLDSYLTVLAAVTGDAERRVGSAPMMDVATRADLLARHDRRRSAGPPGTLTDSFAATVLRDPRAPALHDAASGTVLDYEVLEAWSGDVAAGLIDAGVRRGDVVSLLCPRSPAAVAGLLGVLRAGAAYLPLDPELPAGRLAALLTDARAAVVLAGPDAAARLQVDLPTLTLAPRPPRVARVPAPVLVDPDDIAYVMFTSGSTGSPKGVLVPHRGVVNYVAADRAAHGLGSGDRVLQFTSLQFDVSAEEVFPALDAGACLVLRADDMVDTPQQFVEAVHRLGVTVAHLPTAYFHELVAETGSPGLHPPPGLRLLVIGGEATTPAHLAAWRRAAAHVSVSNAYGPTETTIAATLAPLAGPDAPAGGARVPIGGPIPGAAVFVLDPELSPVPVGVLGEVHVGGAGLARGYLRRPDLTADRFVPDPSGSGGRLYRTGDRARVLRDGQLEFTGRLDDQVKIRGHRVEPGEVEAVLAAADGVRHAAVVPHPGARGVELHAYVELVDVRAPVEATRDRLRAHLASVLPAYLVPSGWTVLAALPRTATDKIDRARLPPPLLPRPPRASPPRTEAERVVAAVWEEVLARPEVGRDDDFFDLGGHSLLAAQAVSRLRHHFGRQVTLRQVFEHPQLSAFAAVVSADSGPAGRPVLRRATGDELLAGVAEVTAPAGPDRRRSTSWPPDPRVVDDTTGRQSR